jgi:hypothetical protein
LEAEPIMDALIASMSTQDEENILNNNIDDDGNHFETSGDIILSMNLKPTEFL